MKKENTPHNIHIGSIIKAKISERGISDTQLAKMIYCHHSTIHHIYKRRSINTEQLWQISLALEYDFFTKIYGFSLPEAIAHRHDSDTTTIVISAEKISIEQNNGIAKITEYKKHPEK
ncbi:MAG: helix-turn-helix domain-containing protein [Bacteroidetes bacterium]|nr:helix-turn-helix domain-containing protein [Bacteroidota bacterium]